MKIPATLSALLFTVTSAFATESIVFRSQETQVQLLELFTSEGCSSCPPADAWISNLKASPDLWTKIVPVVFHVDYWDNLGWPDRFASPAFSLRQQRYAAVWHSDSIYTPGFVLNGRDWRGFLDHQPLPAASSTKVGQLQITLHDHTRAEVLFQPTTGGAKPTHVEIALLGRSESEVKRGENAGRKLPHDFVALKLAAAPLSTGGTATFVLPEKTTLSPVALALWVSNGPNQPPIQSVGGWLKTPPAQVGN